MLEHFEPLRFRFEVFDRDFFRELSRVGLRFRQVWPELGPWAGSAANPSEREAGAEGAGDSTPCGWGEDTMELGSGFDLFPEQQVQIFEIRKGKNGAQLR